MVSDFLLSCVTMPEPCGWLRSQAACKHEHQVCCAGLESPWKEKGSPTSLMRPMMLSCHGQLDSNSRYAGGSGSQFGSRSPFSRSTSAASTPKRKFGEMRKADSPGAWQPIMSGADARGSENHFSVSHAPHVPRLMLPQPQAQHTPIDRYLSPQLHVPCPITDFALQDDYDGEASPRALGRYAGCSHFDCQPENSVDSDDMLACGNMVEPIYSQSAISSGHALSENMLFEEQVDGENVPPVQHKQCATHDMVPDSTPVAVQESSESSYESPPSLVPPQSGKVTTQRNLLGSAAGSECTVEMGCCSPLKHCNPPPSCMLPDSDDADEDVHGSPCMRASVAFAPAQTVQGAPHFQCSKAQHAKKDTRLGAISDSVESSGGSADSIAGDSDCRPGNSCMESNPSQEHCDSPQTSGSTVYSSYYSRSLENVCPNAFPCIPDTPSSNAASDVEQEPCGNDTVSGSQVPALSVQRYQRGACSSRMQVSRQPESDWQAGGHERTCRYRPDTRDSCFAMPQYENGMCSSDMMSQKAAESLTSDEINVWKANHCISALTQGNEDDSLVILTNKLLRDAFRAQRRAEMQKTLTIGGSYAAPRRFLSTPLDPAVLDGLAVPVAVRASETSESVASIIEATLPRTLRLSHCFAAWRYIMYDSLQMARCLCRPLVVY